MTGARVWWAARMLPLADTAAWIAIGLVQERSNNQARQAEGLPSGWTD